jgi:hypothetical protein
MSKRVVFVTDIMEEVDLIFGLEQCGSDGMDRCIAPTLEGSFFCQINN